MRIRSHFQAVKAFSLMELMLVVAIIAILVAFAVPHFREATKKANAAKSGANLKLLNSALAQWDASHSGLPNEDASAPTREPLGPVQIPIDGSSGLCKAMKAYVEDTGTLWTSPQTPEIPQYEYIVVKDENGDLRGYFRSKINGKPEYEPKDADSKSWLWNGYEDDGKKYPQQN